MKTKPPAPPRKAPVAIPPGVDCVLSRRQVQALLDVGRTKFLQMVARGEYPAPDVSLGEQSPRWHQTTHNAWLAAKRAK